MVSPILASETWRGPPPPPAEPCQGTVLKAVSGAAQREALPRPGPQKTPPSASSSLRVPASAPTSCYSQEIAGSLFCFSEANSSQLRLQQSEIFLKQLLKYPGRRELTRPKSTLNLCSGLTQWLVGKPDPQPSSPRSEWAWCIRLSIFKGTSSGRLCLPAQLVHSWEPMWVPLSYHPSGNSTSGVFLQI
jgi:hypothetical protein